MAIRYNGIQPLNRFSPGNRVIAGQYKRIGGTNFFSNNTNIQVNINGGGNAFSCYDYGNYCCGNKMSGFEKTMLAISTLFGGLGSLFGLGDSEKSAPKDSSSKGGDDDTITALKDKIADLEKELKLQKAEEKKEPATVKPDTTGKVAGNNEDDNSVKEPDKTDNNASVDDTNPKLTAEAEEITNSTKKEALDIRGKLLYDAIAKTYGITNQAELKEAIGIVKQNHGITDRNSQKGISFLKLEPITLSSGKVLYPNDVDSNNIKDCKNYARNWQGDVNGGSVVNVSKSGKVTYSNGKTKNFASYAEAKAHAAQVNKTGKISND